LEFEFEFELELEVEVELELKLQFNVHLRQMPAIKWNMKFSCRQTKYLALFMGLE